MKTLRATSLAFAAVIVACSSHQDDDPGCGPLGDNSCTTDADCEGYAGDIDPRYAVGYCLSGTCAARYVRGSAGDAPYACNGSTYLPPLGDGLSPQCVSLTCEERGWVSEKSIDGTACTTSDGLNGSCAHGGGQPFPRSPVNAGSDASVDASDGG